MAASRRPARGARTEPVGACNFEVDLGGEVIGFAQVIGLALEIDRSGERVVGRVGPITLRRGVTGDLAVWSWVRRALSRKFEPVTVRITLLDATRQPVCVWELRHARPVKWSGPELDASAGGEVAMEELVLEADGLEFVSVPPVRPRTG